MTRASDIAPAVTIGLMVAWIALGNVIGYVVITIFAMWLVIRAIEWISYHTMKTVDRYKLRQRGRV